MILKSFGCSFIYGSDLPDDRNGCLIELPNKFTWPSLIAQKLGYSHECYARPGSGNLQILERLLEQINQEQSALYLISWSWIDRVDYIDPSITWPGTKWNTLMPSQDSPLTHAYYKYLNSQYQDKLISLIYIRTAIDHLRERNLPFVMTYMDELIFETDWHSNSVIQSLQDYIQPHMTTFEGQTFLDWAKKKGFPISETLHPLELAHSTAADYMLQLCIDKI